MGKKKKKRRKAKERLRRQIQRLDRWDAPDYSVASANEIRAFLEGPVWADIKDHIEDQIIDHQIQVRQSRGSLQEINKHLDIIDTLTDVLELPEQMEEWARAAVEREKQNERNS